MADPAGRNARAQLEEVTITNHPHPDLPVDWVSDKIELEKWVHPRDLGQRRRREIEMFIAALPRIPGSQDVART